MSMRSDKALVTAVLSGLRQRCPLRRCGGHNQTTFVDTAMTASFRKECYGRKPERIGRASFAPSKRKRRHRGIYTEFWRPIMFVVRTLPRAYLCACRLALTKAMGSASFNCIS